MLKILKQILVWFFYQPTYGWNVLHVKPQKFEKLPNNLLIRGLIRPSNIIIRVWA